MFCYTLNVMHNIDVNLNNNIYIISCLMTLNIALLTAE